MGHLIQWDNADKTVVLQQYIDHPTKDDLYIMAKESARMLKTVDHIVHIIIDERQIKLTLTSSDMQYLQRLTPENQGACIVVVSKSVEQYKNKVRDIGKVFAPDAFDGVSFTETIEEAREFLIKHFGVRYNSYVE